MSINLVPGKKPTLIFEATYLKRFSSKSNFIVGSKGLSSPIVFEDSS